VAISTQLMEKLVCPNCGGDLQYQVEQDRIDCPVCKLGYSVMDDIPVLLVDEADQLQ